MKSDKDRSDSPRGGISMKSAEVFVAAVMLAFGLVVAIDSYRLGAQWGSDGPQSGYFPFYIGVIIVIAAAVTLVQSLLAKAEDSGLFVEWRMLKPVMAVLVPAVVYVLGVQLIGIYVASAIYIAVFMVWLGSYSWLKAVVVSVLINASFYLMFEIWFKVPLFRGAYDLLGLVGL